MLVDTYLKPWSVPYCLLLSLCTVPVEYVLFRYAKSAHPAVSVGQLGAGGEVTYEIVFFLAGSVCFDDRIPV